MQVDCVHEIPKEGNLFSGMKACFWRRILAMTQRRRRRCRLVVMKMVAVRKQCQPSAAVFAAAKEAGASREAVSSQVSCVRAIRISVQNHFKASIQIRFSFPLQQSSKMELKPLNRSFEGTGWETGVPALKTFPPMINVYTLVVCIFTTGSLFDKINQILIHVNCTTVA